MTLKKVYLEHTVEVNCFIVYLRAMNIFQIKIISITPTFNLSCM